MIDHKKPATKICLQCKKIFIQKIYGNGRLDPHFKKIRFCGHSCANVRGGRRTEPYKKRCTYCNKVFVERMSEAGYFREDFKNRRFCSTACSNSGKPPKIDISDAGGSVRARKIMAHIKKCHMCGGTRILEVHHKDRDRKNNDKNNIVKLCKKCHVKIHVKAREGGRKRSTQKKAEAMVA